MKTIIQNARVIDPKSGLDQVLDVAIDQGKIAHVGVVPTSFVSDKCIDARHLLLLPGLIDLAAGVGRSGVKSKNALDMELTAAVASGVTTLVCSAYTKPVLDEPGLVDILCQRAREINKANLYPLGALTPGLRGENITEMHLLHQMGCVGFGQPYAPIRDLQILRRAMQYASNFDYTVWLFAQDADLAQGGQAASGAMATRLGLATIPVSAETIAMHNIFDLMRTTDARVHLSCISSEAGVEVVREAKKNGLALTCDVNINSLHLIDEDISYFDSSKRLTPPLRQDNDRKALRCGLLDGTIDALVSDHTMVTREEKILPFGEAVEGASGLELLLGLTLQWASEDHIPLAKALACVTSRPAQVLSSSSLREQAIGCVSAGFDADLVLIDPGVEIEISAANLLSKSHTTAHEGRPMRGQVHSTFVKGQPVYVRSEQ